MAYQKKMVLGMFDAPPEPASSVPDGPLGWGRCHPSYLFSFMILVTQTADPAANREYVWERWTHKTETK